MVTDAGSAGVSPAGRRDACVPGLASTPLAKDPSYAQRRRAPGGWSLLELLVVLVIIGLLAGLVMPNLLRNLEGGQVRTAETQVKMLRSALLAYRLDVGAFPATRDGLDALMRPPPDVAEFWRGPYLDDEVPLDPWRTPYRYVSPANTLQGFALYSLGADAAEGGEGADADVGLLPNAADAAGQRG